MYGQSILFQVAVCASCLGLGAQSGTINRDKAVPVAQAKKSAEKTYSVVRSVWVSPGALEVRLLSSALRKGIAAREIALCRKGGDTITKLKTRSDGTCTLPVLATGDYVLDLAEGLELELRVAKDATVKKLDIVLKEGDATETRRPQFPEKGIPPLVWGLMLTSGGVVAVGVPIAIENHNDRRKNPVSPTGAQGQR